MEQNRGEIIIYQADDGQTNINVKMQDETVWLTQQQMAELYQTSRTNVVEHIKHIYDEGELDEESTCRNFRQVRKEGNREVAREIPFYNYEGNRKLGYVPEKDNIIFTRLMDAGKLLKAKISKIEQKGSFKQISVGIYLVDF